MLAQLVCVDRRYQRMNCFNIREIQSILKRRFFTDLINTQDHHTLLNKTAIGLRFKLNGVNPADSNMFLMHVYGTDLGLKYRIAGYEPIATPSLTIKSLISGEFSFFNFVEKFSGRRLVRFFNKILLKTLKILDLKNTSLISFSEFYRNFNEFSSQKNQFTFSALVKVFSDSISC